MTQPGTIVMLHTGSVVTSLLHWVRSLPPNVSLLTISGHQIARQRNMGVERMTGDWVLQLDSDMVPRADTLQRLLATEAALVSAVVLERFPPYHLTAIRSLEPEARWTLADIPRSGLLDVYSVGTGCLLIRKEVLSAIRPPWFRCGQLISDLLTEDTEFCIRAGEVGFQTQLACDVRVGHRTGNGTVWPGVDGRPWLALDGPGEYWVRPGENPEVNGLTVSSQVPA